MISLRDPGVIFHVMSKNSATLIKQRNLEELEEVTKKIPAMAYDIESFKSLRALQLNNFPVNVDIQVETEEGAFSLQEYAYANGKPILFKSMDGPLLIRV